MEYSECSTYQELVQQLCNDHGYKVEREGDKYYVYIFTSKDSILGWYRQVDFHPNNPELFVFDEEVRAWAQAVRLALLNMF